jgi:hypothetical protein
MSTDEKKYFRNTISKENLRAKTTFLLCDNCVYEKDQGPCNECKITEPIKKFVDEITEY